MIAVYSMISKFSGYADSAETGQSVVSQMKEGAMGMLPGLAESSGAAAGTPITRSEYIEARVPRIEQLPASAPVYDTLTQAKAYPRLYCMSSTDDAIYRRNFGSMPSALVNGVETVCQCYTQQGTRVDTDFQFCARVVDRGYFDPAVPDRGQDHRQLQPQSVASHQQPQGAAQPQLTVVGSGKPGHLW